MSRLSVGLVALSSVVMVACGGPSTQPPPMMTTVLPTTTCQPKEVQCVGRAVAVCSAEGEWGKPLSCGPTAACRVTDGTATCEPLSPEMLRSAEQLTLAVNTWRAGTAWSKPLDYDALLDAAVDVALVDNGSVAATKRALRHVHLGIPQGHQNLLFADCGTANGTPYALSSYYGVCGVPRGDSVVVTSASADNLLGLKAGDTVVGTDRWKEGDFLEALAREPLCGSSSPSAGHRRAFAAKSLFGLITTGSVLHVVGPDGARRDVTVPAGRAVTPTSCISPFGGYEDFEVQVRQRPDGIVVMRVPGFLSSQHPLPPDSQYDAWVADYIERLRVALDPVRSAPGIIWDARANTGGSQEVALAIAAGMPGAQLGPIISCVQRVVGSTPPTYANVPYGQFDMLATPKLAYSGKVAVLIDESAYSAGDIFAYAVKHRTAAKLVGQPTAGAFGFGGNRTQYITGPAPASITVDGRSCRGTDGVPLEGESVVPDLTVDYRPEDLAAGKDTVLEAAAALLLQP